MSHGPKTPDFDDRLWNCEVCGVRLIPEDVQRGLCSYCKNTIPYSPPDSGYTSTPHPSAYYDSDR